MNDSIFIRTRGKQYTIPKNPAQLEYDKYLRSPRWRLVVRPIRLWIDGYQCRAHIDSCRGPLNVHHTNEAYECRGGRRKGLLAPLVDLLDIQGIVGEIRHTITFCQKHHGAIHGK